MSRRTADVTGAWDEMALVGRIARTHGIHGHVIVNLETDFPERRFRTGAVLHVQRDGQAEPLTITSVRFHQGRPILGCDGIDTMTEAERIVGLELRIPPAALSALPPDTFYRHDLIGCAVATNWRQAGGVGRGGAGARPMGAGWSCARGARTCWSRWRPRFVCGSIPVSGSS